MLKVVITIAVLLAIVLIKKIPYIGGNITAGLAVAGILTFILNGNLNVGNWILAWIDGLDRMAWIMCLAAAGSIFAEINTALGAVDTVIGALKAKFYKSPRALAVSVLFVLCLAGSLMGDAVAASTVIGMLTFGIFASMNLPLHKICCLVVMGASIGSIMPPMTQSIALAATLANTDPDAVMNMGFISVGFVFVAMAIYTCLFLVKKDNVPAARWLPDPGHHLPQRFRYRHRPGPPGSEGHQAARHQRPGRRGQPHPRHPVLLPERHHHSEGPDQRRGYLHHLRHHLLPAVQARARELRPDLQDWR